MKEQLKQDIERWEEHIRIAEADIKELEANEPIDWERVANLTANIIDYRSIIRRKKWELNK